MFKAVYIGNKIVVLVLPYDVVTDNKDCMNFVIVFVLYLKKNALYFSRSRPFRSIGSTLRFSEIHPI